MPHADSALVSSSITTKAELYASVNENLEALLSGHKQNWVCRHLLSHLFTACQKSGLVLTCCRFASYFFFERSLL